MVLSQHLQCLLPHRLRRKPLVSFAFHALVLLRLSDAFLLLLPGPGLPALRRFRPHKRLLHLDRHVLLGLGPEPVARLLDTVAHGHLLDERADRVYFDIVRMEEVVAKVVL